MFKFIIRAVMPLSLLLHCILAEAGGAVNPITVTFQAGTTTFVTGGTGTASYLVSVDPSVTPPGYPLTMNVNNLPSWATQITTGGTACTTAATTCGNLMSLGAGENCCLKLSLNGANLTAGSYSIAPIVATTPKTTYQGQAAATTVTVTAAPQTTTISISPAANTPQILTADGAATLVFTITNTGAATATTITATQPAGWSGVNIATSSDCASLAPASNNCTFTLTSNTPNLAKQFTVQGTNTGAAIPSPYVAFRTHGGLVFSVSGTSPAATAKVVSETDNNRGIQWYNGAYNTIGAQSITDGYYNAPTGTPDTGGNTYKITQTYGLPNNPATYAAAVCYNDTASLASNGDWYLPAICELGTYDPGVGGSDAGCGSSIANIESNLYNLGFLSNLENTFYYWSSTEYSVNPRVFAWNQDFRGVGVSSQSGANKGTQLGVRCSRAFTY